MDPTLGALLSCLDAQRDHVLGSVEGLDAEALSRPVLPTGWSCVGLVQHLALDVERFWFRAVMAGEAGAWGGVDSEEPSAWLVEEGTDPAEVLALYRREIVLSNAVIGAGRLESAPAAWPEGLFGDFRLPDLRAILLHVLAETACHAGHLDAARELLDGRTWLVV